MKLTGLTDAVLLDAYTGAVARREDGERIRTLRVEVLRRMGTVLVTDANVVRSIQTPRSEGLDPDQERGTGR